MRRIPDDVLREIFLHCLDEKFNQRRRSTAKAPLLLCLVCKRWRSVANTTARLWTIIIIEGPAECDWLQRAGQRTRYFGWVSLFGWNDPSQAPLSVYLDLG